MNATIEQILLCMFGAMSDEERLSVFRFIKKHWCIHCGRIQPSDSERPCQCWNDE